MSKLTVLPNLNSIDETWGYLESFEVLKMEGTWHFGRINEKKRPKMLKFWKLRVNSINPWALEDRWVDLQFTEVENFETKKFSKGIHFTPCMWLIEDLFSLHWEFVRNAKPQNP